VTELMASTPLEVTRELAARHAQAGPRWIVGAGCEIPAATPHENVEALVAFARATRPAGAAAGGDEGSASAATD
jgi:uroporphyrinogen-III decarboxylase